MPQDEEGRDFGPHNGHLGTSWEIAVIVVFVVLLIAVVSTLIFHVRRKQRRKRQEQYDLERGRREQAEKELNTSAGDRNSRRQSSFANNSAASLPRPEPAAPRSNRSSRASCHPSQKPPQRYYWDPR
ncbi:hypothetical protein CCMSSC00406_0005819 [Pleurotus cornucopiae]|uniref:Uncharacterized protein n=1 Tax=Pleurotus cornucopiae TaxID=5321 RepID=A0ACB7J7E5_PLECO|nr:hypothetical protein CCMSSC00406_0005819 [Pleurotus cornucopiae]